MAEQVLLSSLDRLATKGILPYDAEGYLHGTPSEGLKQFPDLSQKPDTFGHQGETQAKEAGFFDSWTNIGLTLLGVVAVYFGGKKILNRVAPNFFTNIRARFGSNSTQAQQNTQQQATPGIFSRIKTAWRTRFGSNSAPNTGNP